MDEDEDMSMPLERLGIFLVVVVVVAVVVVILGGGSSLQGPHSPGRLAREPRLARSVGRSVSHSPSSSPF